MTVATIEGVVAEGSTHHGVIDGLASALVALMVRQLET